MKKVVLSLLFFAMTAITLLQAQPFYLRSEEPQCDFGNSNGTCELTDPDMDGIYELVTDWNGFTIGRKEFKIYDAGNDLWYPGGPNAWFDHQGGNMTFRFNTATSQVEAIDNGPFNYCAPGQWNGFDPLGAPMVNVSGNTWCYTVANPGSYEWKPVVCGGGPFGFDSWQPNSGERSVNSANWFITTTQPNEQVCIDADPATGRVFGTAPPATGFYLRSSTSPCTFGNLNPGCQLEDPDGDGIFTLTTNFGGVAQGRQEFKIYSADNDIFYPIGGFNNFWFYHNGGDVTFSFNSANNQVGVQEDQPISICAPGEWNGFNNADAMQNVGNGLFCYTVPTAGTYEWKPTYCGTFDSWNDTNGDRNVEFFGNWTVTTIVDNAQICIRYDEALGTVSQVQVTAVPTMGQWAFIIFSLIMVALGMVLVRQQKLVLSGGQNRSFTFRKMPFDKAFYTKALLWTGVSMAAVFSIAIALFGYEMTNADMPGSLLAMPLVAYIVMLLRGNEKN